jgi:hypothetical protein
MTPELWNPPGSFIVYMNVMLYDLSVWLAVLLLVWPIPLFVLAWVRLPRFEYGSDVRQWQRFAYLLALSFASLSTLAYSAYWARWTCSLYRIIVPFSASIILDRFMRASLLLSAVAILGVVAGRGPHRILLALATLWVMSQLWLHSPVLHWA